MPGLNPTELMNKVLSVVKEGGEYTQALMFARLGIHSGKIQLVANVPQSVVLSPGFAVGVTDYKIWREVYMADGTRTDVEVTSQTNTGFTVVATVDCTVDYLTTYPNLDIQP